MQKVAVALAKAILADEKYDDRHNGGNGKLGYVLVVAAFDEALLDSAAVVKYKPVSHTSQSLTKNVIMRIPTIIISEVISVFLFITYNINKFKDNEYYLSEFISMSSMSATHGMNSFLYCSLLLYS